MDASRLRYLGTHIARIVNTEHLMLGSDGKKRTAVNAFGDHTLVADMAAEKTVIETFRAAGLSMRVVSEEHGEFVTHDDDQEYTLVVDGLDGSGVYERATEEDIRLGRARYGTMFALFRGNRPTYGDALVSCIVEHSTRRLLLALPGLGTTVLDLSGQSTVPTAVKSSRGNLHPGQKVFCEINDPTWGPRLTEFVKPLGKRHINVVSTGSTARHYLDVATGVMPATIEWSRKRNLELMIAYLIIIEAGGAVIRMDCSDLGQFYYDELAQDPDDMQYFIAAANISAAESLRRILIAND